MTRDEATKKAKALIAKMTLEEKASQILYNSPAIKRLGINEYNWWNEALHGIARADVATVFPQSIGLAASFDSELIGDVAQIISTEARAKYNESVAQNDRDIYKGLTLWSPNVNIFRDPRWGRGQETYGEDPFLTSEIGVSFVRNLQGDGEFLRAAACAKHFAVHSGPEKLRHSFNAEISEQDLRETYLPAFEHLVEAGVEGVMGAYNMVNGEPCCAHNHLMGDILFGEWSFKGYFVSDYEALCDFHNGHHITEDAVNSAAVAIKHKCNINCGNAYENLMKAFNLGMIEEKDIDYSVIKAFTTRFMLGEFEEERPYSNIKFEKIDCDEYRKANLETARRTLVLLKNDGILPLDKNGLKSIAVTGPNAMSVNALKGNYSGIASEYVTVVDGIRASAPDAIINYSLGSDIRTFATNDCVGFKNCFSSAVSAARHSDITVVCVGLDSTVEGEELDCEDNYLDKGDRYGVSLPDTQIELLNRLCNATENLIVIIMAGCSVDIGKKVRTKARAIVEAWYPGAQGGNAVADLLFGEYSPSGRLPVTFYDSEQTLPDIKNYSMQNRTYRFYKDTPLYPFGFGLSYSEFSYSNAVIKSKTEKYITVSVTVQNKGKMDAWETTQVYARYSDSRLRTPNYQLCGIKSTFINSGEKAEITLEIPRYWLMAVNEAGKRVIPDKGISLFIGGHQPDDLSNQLCKSKCLELVIKE